MLKLRFALPALAAALFCCHASFAQAPAGAPAGATGQCKDGTYSTAASKTGACRGHKGVQQWFSASAATPAATTTTKAAPAAPAAPAPGTAMTATPPAATKTAKTTSTASTAAAPGGGPGQVWVNTSTKVYHCPGDRYYGKTKAGKYMSEADAKAAGYKADAGKACSN
jgi:hypothetical protein